MRVYIYSIHRFFLLFHRPRWHEAWLACWASFERTSHPSNSWRYFEQTWDSPSVSMVLPSPLNQIRIHGSMEVSLLAFLPWVKEYQVIQETTCGTVPLSLTPLSLKRFGQGRNESSTRLMLPTVVAFPWIWLILTTILPMTPNGIIWQGLDFLGENWVFWKVCGALPILMKELVKFAWSPSLSHSLAKFPFHQFLFHTGWIPPLMDFWKTRQFMAVMAFGIFGGLQQ